MDKFNRFLKSIWLGGGILCLLVFIFRATPILLNALDIQARQDLAVFLIFFGCAILLAWAVFFFTEQFEKIKDRRHFYHIRQRQRELELQEQEQQQEWGA